MCMHTNNKCKHLLKMFKLFWFLKFPKKKKKPQDLQCYFPRKSSQNSEGCIIPVFDQLNKKLLCKNKTKQKPQGNFLSSQNDHVLIALRNFHLCNKQNWQSCVLVCLSKNQGSQRFVGCRTQPLDEEVRRKLLRVWAHRKPKKLKDCAWRDELQPVSVFQHSLLIQIPGKKCWTGPAWILC